MTDKKEHAQYAAYLWWKKNEMDIRQRIKETFNLDELPKQEECRGSVVNQIKNEMMRLIDEYSLSEEQQQELATVLSTNLNFLAWEKAIINLRKQLDTAVSYLSEEEYNLFLAEVQRKNDK